MNFKLGVLSTPGAYGRIELDIKEISVPKQGWLDLGLDSTQIFANDLETTDLLTFQNFSRDKTRVMYAEFLKLILPNIKIKKEGYKNSLQVLDK